MPSLRKRERFPNRDYIHPPPYQEGSTERIAKAIVFSSCTAFKFGLPTEHIAGNLVLVGWVEPKAKPNLQDL